MEKKLVTSLELSKELKELGCEQESEFSWFYYKPYHIKNEFGERDVSEDYKVLPTNSDFYNNPPKRVASAFLSGECGEMLPEGCFTYRFENWFVARFDELRNIKAGFEGANTEAEARGKMLAFLIKNGLIK